MAAATRTKAAETPATPPATDAEQKPDETANTANPTETKLDDNVTEPSTVAPGDAPADTTDPTEISSTVTPTPSQDALKVGTVNGAIKVETPPAPAKPKTKDRFETYTATKPDGTVVKIKRNIDTGASEIVE